jgi:F-box protein 11
MVAKPEPVGFFSYVHDDDGHEGGRLTLLHGRLEGEVRLQTGEQFRVFLDRRDIRWSQQWKKHVDGSLDTAVFLFPVITPAFFRSRECRRELERFLEVEAKLGRDDLIFPIYYFNCPILNDPEKRKSDPLAEIIAGRQYFDLREFRFEPFTSPTLGRLLAGMAGQIVEAMERGAPTALSPLPAVAERSRQPARPVEAQAATGGSAASQPTARSGPTDKTEPPIHIVDPLHRGDFTNLTDALVSANPGDRIVVRPGLYREAVVIDKVVEIIGDGDLGTVVIEATGKNVIQFKANAGRIANLTLRQAGGGKWYCIDVAQGRLSLEGCDITSQSLACVAIHSGADPWLRRNRIHNGTQSGVFVYGDGQGVLEDNDIFANAYGGIEIKDGANPAVRRNRIHDGRTVGVMVGETGQGVLEDNDIFGNAWSGIETKKGGNPTVRRNRIHDGKQSGVYVQENGQGVLEDNDIFSNAFTGIEVNQGGNPIVRGNRISKNGRQAVRVYNGGRGTFENNDLRDNTKGAWDIDADCIEHVVRKDNKE